MAKRFVIAVDRCPEYLRQAVTARVKGYGKGWWHWFGDLWLVYDSAEELSTSQIRDDIRRTAPDKNVLVFEVPEGDTDWAQFAPTKASEWLNKYW